MSYNPLTLKYRPRQWRDLVGQEVMVQTITNMLKANKLVPCLVFGGSRGIGKTTSARILAKTLNCKALDKDFEPCSQCDSCVAIAEERTFSVQELDAASHGLVDDVRRIKEEVQYHDAGGGHRVYIIDEAHGLTEKAWQAFLKLLEEPPPNTIFVFCTTETHKIPETIISRSMDFVFARLTNKHIIGRLQLICGLENIQVNDHILTTIARHVNGGMRDAISLLEQLISYAGSKPIAQEHVDHILGVVNEELLFKLFHACLAADIKQTYDVLQAAYVEISDVSSLVSDATLFYRELLLVKIGVPLEDVQPDRLLRLKGAVEQIQVEYIVHCQTELAFIADQMRRSRLPAKNVLEIYVPRLFFGGMRTNSIQVTSLPQPTTSREQINQLVFSVDDVVKAFDGTVVSF